MSNQNKKKEDKPVLDVIKRRENVFLAKVFQSVDKFELMIKKIVEIVEFEYLLTTEERKLLASAYKNLVAPLRISWRK